MNLEEIAVLDLIPQKPPFVFVDKLIEVNSEAISTEFVIREDNLLVDNGLFSPEGLIENVAQSCAVRLGYINRQTNIPVKIGVIGSLKNLDIQRLPVVGEKIVTRIEVLDEIFSMALVSATIFIEDSKIAQTEITIALSDIVAMV